MRAALIREVGAAPAPADIDEPGPDEGVLQVAAVALNPIDVAVGAGRFYGGSPPLPYVPGCEGVGRLAESDERVFVFGGGLGVRRAGTLAEKVPVDGTIAIPIPDDADDEAALASGIAGLAGWMPLAWRAPVREDDRVLVLGATGAAGTVAVQAARLLGAAKVVAAGRNPERLERAGELGADETVDLRGTDRGGAFRAAFGDEGPTLVVDLLWSWPCAAAVESAAPGARVVQIGQSAGPHATLRSSDVRGKQLELLGYSNLALDAAVAREGYLELLGHVSSGRIKVEAETFELESIAEAWRRQAEGPGAKVVVTL